jgi:hypothetical protein
MRPNRDAYLYVVFARNVIGVLMRVWLFESMVTSMNRNLLQERGERVDQRKCLAAIAICRATTQSFTGVLLIEPKPYPRDQPPKLDEYKWALKPDYAHDSRKCDICHRKCL